MQICFERKKERQADGEKRQGEKRGGGRERLIRTIFTSVIISIKAVKTCFGRSLLPHAAEGNLIFGWIETRIEMKENEDSTKRNEIKDFKAELRL